MIDLWTFYFEVMQEYLDRLLDILVACICQGKPPYLFLLSFSLPPFPASVLVYCVVAILCPWEMESGG